MPLPQPGVLPWFPRLVHPPLSRKCCLLPQILSLTLHLNWFPAFSLCPALACNGGIRTSVNLDYLSLLACSLVLDTGET